ncbi:hypothetical protein STANM309S_02058 [Streptomyces tanashiensis]
MVGGDGGPDDGVPRLVGDLHGPLDPGDVLGERRVRPVRHRECRHRPGQRHRPAGEVVHRARELGPPLDDLAHLVAQQKTEVQADLTPDGRRKSGVGHDVPQHVVRLVGPQAHHGATGEERGEPGAGVPGHRTGRQRRFEQARGALLLTVLLEPLGGPLDGDEPSALVAARTAVTGESFPGDRLARGQQARGPPVQQFEDGAGRPAPDGVGGER